MWTFRLSMEGDQTVDIEMIKINATKMTKEQ